MSRVDALGFLTTAAATLVVNAVLAIALGCSFYIVRYLYVRLIARAEQHQSAKKMMVGGAH